MQGCRPPFTSMPLPNLHISSFGVISKKGQPGKWRLVVDLSSPQGASVNDGVSSDEFSMHYIKLDQIISMIAKHGSGALMAKFDVEAAYRNIAVHPEDRYLLGMKWRGQFFVDLALPFGLRSAPHIFNSVAELVEWIIRNKHNVPDLLHYLQMTSSLLVRLILSNALKIYKHCWLSVAHSAFPFTPTSALARPHV